MAPSTQPLANAQPLDRRSFVKAAGASAALACTTAAVAVPTAQASEASSVPAWDFECEVLVCGFGGSGAVAAVTAYEEGAQVLIIEKAAHSGGGVSSTAGANTCAVYDADKAFEYVKACCQGLTPDEVIRAWADEGATLTTWLDEHGIGWSDRGDAIGFVNVPGVDGNEEIVRLATLTDPDDNAHAGGHYFMQWARTYMDEHGIEIKFGTRATQLVQDPATKEVLGVLADQDGQTVAIRATKGVVLATGGFECDDQMMGNYVRPWPLKPAGWPLNTGDGQKMCMEIGANMWHMNMVAGSGYVFDEPNHVVGRTNFKNYVANGAFIFVNRHGERFQCENPGKYWSHISTLAFDTFQEDRQLPTTEYRDIPFYCVFDETLRTAGSLFPDTGKVSGLPLVPADLGGQDHTWSDDNLEEVEMGWILKADTLEELAEAINADAADHNFTMDGAQLAATVERWNEICAADEDPDFGRPSSNGTNLMALDNPPYYAMRFVPAVISTCGGPEKNAKGQLIDVRGNVIPRLYGAGVLSHTAAHTYAVNGFNWSEVFNGGRIAGRNAAAEVAGE